MEHDKGFLLRLFFGPDLRFGPGKAELLALIETEGSISAAGRRMGMSYRRAWSLIEELNAAFRLPLVDASRGGPGGGGARLTEEGVRVLGHFRALERLLAEKGAADIAAIASGLAHPQGGRPE